MRLEPANLSRPARRLASRPQAAARFGSNDDNTAYERAHDMGFRFVRGARNVVTRRGFLTHVGALGLGAVGSCAFRPGQPNGPLPTGSVTNEQLDGANLNRIKSEVPLTVKGDKRLQVQFEWVMKPEAQPESKTSDYPAIRDLVEAITQREVPIARDAALQSLRTDSSTPVQTQAFEDKVMSLLLGRESEPSSPAAAAGRPKQFSLRQALEEAGVTVQNLSVRVADGKQEALFE